MKKFTLVKYAIIAFIIIAIYNGNFNKIKIFAKSTSSTIQSIFRSKPDAPKPQEELASNSIPFKVSTSNQNSPLSNITVDIINKILDNPNGKAIFEEIVNKMVHNYHGTIGEDIIHREYIAKDIIPGTGSEAQCGDFITISYSTHFSEKKQENKKSPFIQKEIRLGDHKLNKGIENGIIGMKENGERRIIFSTPELAKSNQDKKEKHFLVAEVILQNIKNKYNTEIPEWGIFIDKESIALIGPKMLCGDSIDAYYTIRNMNGDALYNSKQDNKKINFTIGGKNTPQKISKGLMGLVKNKSKISVVLNKKDLLYKDKNGNALLPNATDKEIAVVELDTNILESNK